MTLSLVGLLFVSPASIALADSSIGIDIFTSSGGTITSNGLLTASSGLTVTSGTLTLTGATIAGGSPLIFEGSTTDANQTTFVISDPTASRTITLPDASGTVAISASNPITLSALGDLGIDVTTTGTTATTSSNSGLEVGADGLRMLGGCADTEVLKWSAGSGAWQCSSDSTGAGGPGSFTTLSSTGATTLGNNSATVAIDSSSWDISTAGVVSGLTGLTSTGTVDLTGAMIVGASPLVFEGSTTDVNQTTLAISDPTASRTITLPDASGTVAVSASNPITLSALGDLGIDVTTTGTTATTSSNSGLEVGADGLRMLGGCADTEVLKWSAGSGAWQCSSDSTSSANTFLNGGNAFGANARLAVTDGFNLLVGGVTASSDVAPGSITIQAGSAYPQAVTNTAGKDLILGSGLGQHYFTVTDYTLLAGKVVKVAVNQGLGTPAGAATTTLTEGVDWSGPSSGSNNACAASLATAIGTVTGVTAVAVGAVVYVTAATTTNRLSIDTDATSGLTVTTTANGAIFLNASGIAVQRDGTNLNFQGTTYTNAVGGTLFIGEKSRGSQAIPLAVQANDTLVSLVAHGHDGTSMSGSKANLSFLPNENWVAGTNNGTYLQINLTPNASTAQGIYEGADTNGYYVRSTGGYQWSSSTTMTSTKTIDLKLGRILAGQAYLAEATISADPTPSDGKGLLVTHTAGGTQVNSKLISYAASNNFEGFRAGGTLAAPTNVTADLSLSNFRAWGYGATKFGGTALIPSASIQMNAAEAFDDTHTGSYVLFNTVTIGTNTSAARLRLDNNGVIVNSTNLLAWASGAGLTGTPTLDTRISRLAAGSLSLDTTTTGNGLGSLTGVTFQSPSGSAFLAQSQGVATATFGTAGAASAIIKTNNTTAITIDSSQRVTTADGLTVSGNLTLGPSTAHIISTQTTAPTAGGTCTGPAVTAGSTDTKGNVTATSCTSGQTVTVSFNTAYASAPTCVALPANSAAAALSGATSAMFVSATTSVLTITSPGLSTTAPSWNYICVQ